MAPKRKLSATEHATDQDKQPKRVLRSAKIIEDGSKSKISSSHIGYQPKITKSQQPKTSKAKSQLNKKDLVEEHVESPPGATAASRSHLPNYCNKEKRAFWLMKAEPNSRLENGVDIRFSIDDLASKTKPEPWDGIRNHVAKNNLLAMKKGDLALFYHSNCKVPGVCGIMEVVGEAKSDPSQFDPKSAYYDAKSSVERPKWFAPFVEFREKFDDILSLEDLKKYRDEGLLKDMEVLKMSRLSVTKVRPDEWDFVLKIIEGRRMIAAREEKA